MSIAAAASAVASDADLHARMRAARTDATKQAILSEIGIRLTDDDLDRLRRVAQSGPELTDEDLERLIGGDDASDIQAEIAGGAGLVAYYALAVAF